MCFAVFRIMPGLRVVWCDCFLVCCQTLCGDKFIHFFFVSRPEKKKGTRQFMNECRSRLVSLEYPELRAFLLLLRWSRGIDPNVS